MCKQLRRLEYINGMGGPQRNEAPPQNIAGFTLIETLVVLLIAGIMAALAAPAFNAQMERRRIVAAAEAIASDLRWARGEAIKRNADVTVAFDANANPWAYAMSVGGTQIKVADGAAYPDIGISHTFAGNDTVFNCARGSAQAGSITLTSLQNQYQLIVKVSMLGRVRICSPNGGVPGYDTSSC